MITSQEINISQHYHGNFTKGQTDLNSKIHSNEVSSSEMKFEDRFNSY